MTVHLLVIVKKKKKIRRNRRDSRYKKGTASDYADKSLPDAYFMIEHHTDR